MKTLKKSRKKKTKALENKVNTYTATNFVWQRHGFEIKTYGILILQTCYYWFCRNIFKKFDGNSIYFFLVLLQDGMKGIGFSKFKKIN